MTNQSKFYKIFALLLSCVLLLGILCACDDTNVPEPSPEPIEEYDLEYYVTFPAIETGYEISPFIYGEFLEHISGCIYGVIWAELIQDRKFYYPVGEEGLSPWQITGEVQSTDDCYSLNGYAPSLTTDSAISQSINFNKQSYTGYFYAKGNGTVQVTVGNYNQSFNVNGDYEKFTFEFSAESGDQNVIFACTNGQVTLDSLSLMPADNYCGMRIDTLNALKELGGTIYRWPGGNFVSGYNWKDGIGDRDKRVCLRNQAWFPDKGDIESDKKKLADGMGFYSRIEPNDMGTDEFLAMCNYIGATPYLAVNTGTGSPQEAVDYVNYCNGAVTTEYGAIRATNGHAAPYNVKYWCVGNEMQGDWQIGHVSIGEYTKIHNSFVDAMRNADSTIVVSGCGDNVTYWSDSMFSACADRMDYIGEHLYAERNEDDDALNFINSAVNNFQTRIDNHRKLIAKYPAGANIKIAFDEYAYNWTGQPTMKDAMGIASILNLFIQNADVVGMANYSDAVFLSTKTGAPGATYAYGDHVEFSTIGRVLQAYAKYMQGYVLKSNIRQTDRTTYLQYQATIDADCKTITLAVTNPSDKTIKLSVKGIDINASTSVSIVGTGEMAQNGLTEGVIMTEQQSPTSLIMSPQSVNVFVFNIE